MKIPIVTIVGKPNVGKSTLFNKIAGARIAITDDRSGTTRDRLFHKVTDPTLDFYLVDTGGLEFGKGESTIEDDMRLQSRVALEEGDLVLFVVDSKHELNQQDYQVAELLRRTVKKPALLVVNKCDTPLTLSRAAEYYQLGLGEPYQVSAIHKSGIDILLGDIVTQLKDRHFITKDDPDYQRIAVWEANHPNIAFVGKPNVGKSSLINALLNKEKLIVSDIPGTTRDTTDTVIKMGDSQYNLIDTAGLKRPGKTARGVEKFSALRSMAAIERSDIALLVIDSSAPISHQDQQIANHILKEAKGLILVANKWDIKDEEIEEKERRVRFIGRLKQKFPFLAWAPVVFTSAVTKKNLHHIFQQVDEIIQERKKRIPTARLNTFLDQALKDHPPTGTKRVKPKIYYITQAETKPPLFKVFVNKKSAFHFSYLRYLENRIREKFAFTGTAIRVEYKEKEGGDRKSA
jgi:GTP-binding protein